MFLVAWLTLGAGSWCWADAVDEWDLDSELLHAMEAREDRERGADEANADTFGDGAGGWSFEEQLEANQRLSECASPPVPVPPAPEPVQPADPKWAETADALSAEQQRFATMKTNASSGLLWSKCACSDKWADTWRLWTKEHVRRASDC